MPTYSFGEDSPLKFEISDKLATRYNEAVEEFFRAQRRFSQKFGRRWNPETDPIAIRWTKKQKRAWNQFAEVFKRAQQAGGPYEVNDIMDDFLVKNAASVAVYAAGKFGRTISVSAMGGALYGALRGL